MLGVLRLIINCRIWDGNFGDFFIVIFFFKKKKSKVKNFYSFMERMEHNCELEIICTTQSRSLARETQISQICGMQRGPTDLP